MADPQPRERLVRMSLRGILGLFVICAVALVSLQFASATWEVLLATVVSLAFAAAVVVALVDQQARQAFAIGFAVLLAVYVGLVVSQGFIGTRGPNLELNPDTGKLPTTRLMRPVFATVARIRWIDYRSGKVVLNHDPNNPGPDARFISLDERPTRASFMRVAHCWWALALGYLGGLFGRFVYLRRATLPGTLAPGRH
jgi:hypothetical protein